MAGNCECDGAVTSYLDGNERSGMPEATLSKTIAYRDAHSTGFLGVLYRSCTSDCKEHASVACRQPDRLAPTMLEHSSWAACHQMYHAAVLVVWMLGLSRASRTMPSVLHVMEHVMQHAQCREGAASTAESDMVMRPASSSLLPACS